jgi:GH24 family phage-related lysozyme (muramidase)
MKISRVGIDLIKSFEGCELHAYKCAAGVWTIGYGHTAGVKEGDKITHSQADAFLAQDLNHFEDGVMELIRRATQSQFDAMVSFAFNLGLGNLRKSTLLKYHNKGLYLDAAAQFGCWKYAQGRVLLGLVRRREAERKLYLS